MTSGSTHEEASFVSLDDLDNISTLLYEVDDLEEKFTDLLNYLLYTQIMYRKYGVNSNGFKCVF